MWKIFEKAKSSVRKSIPKTRHVHGIEVKKAKMGEFIEALTLLQDVPEELARICFPDMTPGEVLVAMKTADAKFLASLMTNFFLGMPGLAMDTLSKLGGFELEALESLGLTEFLDVAQAWWEINDFSDFLRRSLSILSGATQTPTPPDGSSNGSLSLRP